jgi:hypothetical protein
MSIRTDVTLPSFLFVGTAKAGTTSIEKYLKQHPDICIPRKETFYFLKDIYRNNHLSYPLQRRRDEYILNKEVYEEEYSGIEAMVTGEVGTGYLFHHELAIPRIKETLGDDVKILMVLRHPVDRCYSSYLHFAKDLHENGTFEEALDSEEKRFKEGWDFMWQHRWMGLYAKQVEAYLGAFKEVKVLFYEDFRRAPDVFMKEVFEFIDVNPNINLDLAKTHNASGTPKNETLQRFITQETFLKRLVRPLFRLVFSKDRREKIRKEAKGRNLKKSEGLSVEQRSKLMSFYSDDIAELSALIGRPLTEIWN